MVLEPPSFNFRKVPMTSFYYRSLSVKIVLRKNPQSSDQINDVVNDLHFSKYKNTLKVRLSKLKKH